MTNNTVTQTKREFCCSFCGKTNKQVKFLIAGPAIGDSRIFICDECVDVCNEIISGQTPPLTEKEIEALENSR